jgi:hypothetical protein
MNASYPVKTPKVGHGQNSHTEKTLCERPLKERFVPVSVFGATPVVRRPGAAGTQVHHEVYVAMGLIRRAGLGSSLLSDPKAPPHDAVCALGADRARRY